MSTQKRIVITGGSGFIGAHFCHQLKARGDEVIILDLIEPSSDIPHDRFVQGDIRDEAAVREAFEL